LGAGSPAEQRDAGSTFSAYRNMAHFATFDTDFIPTTQKPIRSYSLLHIAVVKSDISGIEEQAEKVRLDYPAGDGLAPLHWSIGAKSTASLEKLLALGANPDVISIEGATPIMNAVQSSKIDHLTLLLKAVSFAKSTGNEKIMALLHPFS
jgi:ankyrin repeat protein